jgi:hypothetical protein
VTLRRSLDRLLAAGIESPDWLVGRSKEDAGETRYQFRGSVGNYRVGYIFLIHGRDLSDAEYADREAHELERAEVKILAEAKLMAEAKKTLGGGEERTTFIPHDEQWLRAQRAPSLIIVTPVTSVSGWVLSMGRDGRTTMAVDPGMEARARELFPGVPVEKGGGG